MADYSIKLFEIAHRKVQNNNFSQFKHLKLHLFPKLLVIARWYLKKRRWVLSSLSYTEIYFVCQTYICILPHILKKRVSIESNTSV